MTLSLGYKEESHLLHYFLYSLLFHLLLSAVFLLVGNLRKQETPKPLQVTLYFDPFSTKSDKAISAPPEKKDSLPPADFEAWSKRKNFVPSSRLERLKVPGFLRSKDRSKLTLKDKEWLEQLEKTEKQKRLQQEQPKTLQEKTVKEPIRQKAVEKVTEESKLSKMRKLWQKKQGYKAYSAALEQLVKSNWHMPVTKLKKFTVTVEAIIDSKGTLLSCQVIKSSGSPIIDGSAEKAVKVSAPFPEFPKTFNPNLKSIPFQFRFFP